MVAAIALVAVLGIDWTQLDLTVSQYGRPFAHEHVERLAEGMTTDEVEALLEAKPRQVARLADGRTRWRYEHMRRSYTGARRAFCWIPPALIFCGPHRAPGHDRRLDVFFRDGRLSEYEYVVEELGR